jgi:hypothetical protein
MRGQRVWKPVGPVGKNAEIARLYLELASFNERIQELEKQHPEASKIDALRAGALALARQIDEICCSRANDLADCSQNSVIDGDNPHRPVPNSKLSPGYQSRSADV